jgi:hypothetical protein
MEELYHRIDALAFDAQSPLQYFEFEPVMNFLN